MTPSAPPQPPSPAARASGRTRELEGAQAKRHGLGPLRGSVPSLDFSLLCPDVRGCPRVAQAVETGVHTRDSPARIEAWRARAKREVASRRIDESRAAPDAVL